MRTAGGRNRFAGHALRSHASDADGTAARAYPPPWRLLAALLFAVSRASLPAMLAALLFRSIPITPLMLFRTVLLFFVLPGLGASAVRLAMRATVRIADGLLVVARLGVRTEVPTGDVAAVRPWRAPLPGPGLAIVLADGRRLRDRLELPDPSPFLRALADATGRASIRAAMAHPTVVYADAKRIAGAWRWYHLAGKFPLFALGPTAVLFNAHQHIAYGGLLGEYSLLGLGAYVETLAIYWATVTIYQLLYASVWRGLAEGAALLAAWLAPARAVAVRRAAEIVCRVLYYAGIPALVALRFAPW